MINVGKYSIHGSYGLSRFDRILDLETLSVFSGGSLSEAAGVKTSRLKSCHVDSRGGGESLGKAAMREVILKR